MKLTLQSKNKTTGRYTFIVKNATPPLMNALRRAVISQVPTMAIDTVEFSKNSGALYDEMIAHRLGLIPLKTDFKSYSLQEKCTCEGAGCQRCTLKFSLKVKGPGYVYASDLDSQDPTVVPAHEKIIITKLMKGQELALVATATMGNGSTHAKYVPGLVWYEYQPVVTVNASHKDFEEFKDKYPEKAFKNGKLDAKAIEENNLIEACSGVNNDIVSVTYDNSSFLFHVEPWGQLRVKEILAQALSLLDEQLSVLQKALK